MTTIKSIEEKARAYDEALKWMEGIYPTLTHEQQGEAEEIIINLKRIEKDYRIDLTREIEWLRSKVKKGE